MTEICTHAPEHPEHQKILTLMQGLSAGGYLVTTGCGYASTPLKEEYPHAVLQFATLGELNRFFQRLTAAAETNPDLTRVLERLGTRNTGSFSVTLHFNPAESEVEPRLRFPQDWIPDLVQVFSQ